MLRALCPLMKQPNSANVFSWLRNSWPLIEAALVPTSSTSCQGWERRLGSTQHDHRSSLASQASLGLEMNNLCLSQLARSSHTWDVAGRQRRTVTGHVGPGRSNHSIPSSSIPGTRVFMGGHVCEGRAYRRHDEGYAMSRIC